MEIQPKLKVFVNNNPTKEGIRIQFIFPENQELDKQILTPKLQKHINESFKNVGWMANIDNDVPYDNIIGFLITIDNIHSFVKNLLQNGNKPKISKS